MTKKIKLIKLDDEYAILEIGPHVVYVKAEEGGIVCDVFADDIAESPTVSCWAEYAEMEDEDVEFDHTTWPSTNLGTKPSTSEECLAPVGSLHGDNDKILTIELNDGGCIEAPDTVGTMRRRDCDGCLQEIRSVGDDGWEEWASLFGVKKEDYVKYDGEPVTDLGNDHCTDNDDDTSWDPTICDGGNNDTLDLDADTTAAIRTFKKDNALP